MIFSSKRIKSFMVVFLVLVFFLFKPSYEYKLNKEDEIIGLWKNKDINIEFTSNRKVIIKILKEDGTLEKQLLGSFNINLSKHPVTIDLKNLNGISGSLFAIIKINKELELIMSKFSTSWKQRPLSFNNRDIIKFIKGNK